MVSRFLFNFLLFALLLGVLGGVTLATRGGDGDAIVRLVIITVLGAAWAGGLIALIETQIYPLDGVKRLALAGLCGGLAYVGLIAGLAQVTAISFGLSTPVMMIGAFVIGAGSHAVRAQLYGDREAEE